MANITKNLPFMDPSIRWYVKPSLNHMKMITGNTPVSGSINYSCDDAICFPKYYGGYLSWYNPSTGSVGSRMFDRQEAWDHSNHTNPNTEYPYNGKAVIIPGYGGYFLAVHLTDGSNIVQVNIIRRYLDDTILIYNTGKYGDSSRNISVTVNDPPGGYSVQTNGTRSANTTTLAPGKYVLFYKGTAPAVDTANGLFSTSPLGTSKSQPYELWTNAFTHTGRSINIPKMYLGVKAPTDMEVISNGAYPGAHETYMPPNTNGYYEYPLCGWGGQNVAGTGHNISWISNAPDPSPWIRLTYVSSHFDPGPRQMFGAWFGWGEDESNNVKFIILSMFNMFVSINILPMLKNYVAYIYDIERNEAYTTTIINPIRSTYSFGEEEYDPVPIFSPVSGYCYGQASAFAYIDANDTWIKIGPDTSPTSTWTFYDDAYGFCNYCDKTMCAEGLGIYTDDPNYTPPPPKSAFGAARLITMTGIYFVRVPSLGSVNLNVRIWGFVYAVITRLKTFPKTTSDTDLQNWFKSLPPKSLTSDDFNNLLSILPGSFWLFGKNDDIVNISYPSSVGTGSQFTVNVSCPARPNTTAWVALVDGNGNIVASNSGTTDANGNASITLTMPNTPGTYRVLAIVKGDRQLV